MRFPAVDADSHRCQCTKIQLNGHSPLITSRAIDDRASRAGLRTVAAFEALKGVLVLLLLFALIAVHNRIEDYAEDLLYHLHIDFDHQFAQSFLKAASRLNDSRLWTVVAAAAMYAVCALSKPGVSGIAASGRNGSPCSRAHSISLAK